jgi:hypothetical protein
MRAFMCKNEDRTNITIFHDIAPCSLVDRYVPMLLRQEVPENLGRSTSNCIYFKIKVRWFQDDWFYSFKNSGQQRAVAFQT